MRMSGRPHMHEVSRLLAARIEVLSLALIGTKPSIKARGEWRWGSKGSFTISVTGETRGLWFDHETGTGGDSIDLICLLRRCVRREAWLWAVDWLGQAQETRRAPVDPTARSKSENAASDFWASVWRTALPAAGSQVECYLVSRGLVLPPDAPLRFHPTCPHGVDKLPAMVALMTDPATGLPCGVHRTFLQPDGSGKADVQPARMMLGHAGVIRLAPDDQLTAGLGIAEGIETSLAIMQHAGWRPVWAACSAGGMAKFSVLPGVAAITAFADADDLGAGLAAAHICVQRWQKAGREATVQQPPEGTDWLDSFAGTF